MSSISVTLLPMVFAGSLFYPFGGWEDYKGCFKNVDEARNFILSIAIDDFNGNGWAHIVWENEIIENWRYDGYGEERLIWKIDK